MAVRAFDITEVAPTTLSVLDSAPRTRRDARRLRQRYAVIGVLSLSLPFVAALIVVGVVR